MDGFDKDSGYDPTLSAEMIRLMNMWMAMVTELYKAVESCRDGSVDMVEEGFNPVDHAAAFWFGNAQYPDVPEGGSLYAWAMRAEANFVEQSKGVNDELITSLSNLQDDYESCKSLSSTDQAVKADAMRQDVDQITRIMTVPLVQNFIMNLATRSGMGEGDEIDYLIVS